MNYCRATAVAIVLGLSMLTTTAHAQDSELVEMIVEFMGDSDFRSLAFDKIRNEAKGEAATKRFAEQLDKLNVDGQIGLISALADRGDIAAKSPVTAMLDSESETVRVAVIRALAKLGDESDCEKLVSLLAEDSAEKSAVTTTLIQIQGQNITTAIADQIQEQPVSVQVQLIDILASRRALDAIPRLLELAKGDQPELRSAAMTALGSIASPDHLPEMVQGILKAEPGREKTNAERNVAKICNQISDVQNRSAPLLEVYQTLDAGDRNAMLATLGRVGGDAALKEIETAISSTDGTTHSRGIGALASWPDASVAGRLKEIAFQDPHLNHQLTALRALLRVAPLADGRPDQEKLELLQQTMQFTARVADRNYALQRASAIRIPETLRWVMTFIDDPRYTEQACQTIVELAHIRDLRDDNKAEFHAALDKVMAISKDPTVLERADRYKKGRTWVRPK